MIHLKKAGHKEERDRDSSPVKIVYYDVLLKKENLIKILLLFSFYYISIITKY